MMRINRKKFRLLKKKTAPAVTIRRTPMEISTLNTKLETVPEDHLEEARRIKTGRYGVTIKTIKTYPYNTSHLGVK